MQIAQPYSTSFFFMNPYHLQQMRLFSELSDFFNSLGLSKKYCLLILYLNSC